MEPDPAAVGTGGVEAKGPGVPVIQGCPVEQGEDLGVDRAPELVAEGRTEPVDDIYVAGPAIVLPAAAFGDGQLDFRHRGLPNETSL